MKNNKFNLGTFVICLLIVFLIVGGIGSIFTSNNTNTEWYSSIKPSITPPNWVFPVVWNILFLLITFSLYFAWTSSRDKQQKTQVVLLFGINFILNIWWSVLFFGLKLLQLAFVEVIIFWFSILALIIGTTKINKKSAWLLIPYLLWVAFASILTYLAAFS
ncbi:MAG: TspO/MBR family protein [Nanobdellota archaeon]